MSQHSFSVGDMPWSNEEFVQLLEEFHELYQTRPIRNNDGGQLAAQLFYSWFVGSMVQNMGMYLLCLLFSSTAFSGVLSLMSAIASKASNNISLMAILSFPVLMPLILVSVKLSKFAIDGLAWSVSFKYLLILVMLNFVVIALATLLFNYLWKD